MDGERTKLTLEQVLAARRALRQWLAFPAATFSLSAFVGMIGDEIEGMRASGHGDDVTVAVVESATGIVIEPSDLARFHAARGRGR